MNVLTLANIRLSKFSLLLTSRRVRVTTFLATLIASTVWLCLLKTAAFGVCVCVCVCVCVTVYRECYECVCEVMCLTSVVNLAVRVSSSSLQLENHSPTPFTHHSNRCHTCDTIPPYTPNVIDCRRIGKLDACNHSLYLYVGLFIIYYFWFIVHLLFRFQKKAASRRTSNPSSSRLQSQQARGP